MKLIAIIQKTLLLLLLMGSISCSYLPEAYEEDPNLIVEENAAYISLTSSTTDNTKAGIVFYPGGLVDPHAYIAPLKKMAVEDNRTIIILKVASNLAILNTQKASSITKEITAVNRWIVGGHSLGGSVSCIDVFNNPNDFDALFLLAAYSINDLSDSTLPIISITASEDEVLNNEKFDENAINLPEGITVNMPTEILDAGTSTTTIYYEIEGGNHAQFGDYGDQAGDGTASIDADLQHTLVIDMLRAFFSSNNL